MLYSMLNTLYFSCYIWFCYFISTTLSLFKKNKKYGVATVELFK